MMHIAANISSENGQERPIGCARNFPFDTREKRSDQQHGGYPFNPKFRPFCSPVDGGKCLSALINLSNERSILN